MRQDKTGNCEPGWLCNRQIVSRGVLDRAKYINLEVNQPCPGPEFLTELVDRFLMGVLPTIQEGSDLVNWKGREPEAGGERSPQDRFDCLVAEGTFGLPGGSLEHFRVKVDCIFDSFGEGGAIRYRVGIDSEGALPDWLPLRLVGRSYSIFWTKVLICLERFRPTLISGLLDLMPTVEDQVHIEATAAGVRVSLVLRLGDKGAILEEAPAVEGYVRYILRAVTQEADSLLISR